tara:strand:+ start:4741 stop:5721 length:981 start_codon:yes stop_codon:yes gene_type:complete
MNLRISLILIIILSWVSIFGVLVYKSDIGKEKEDEASSYFYRISSKDITNISISHDATTMSWHLEDNIWYFDNLKGIPADSYRWGGIIDLLAGPKLYRTISENIENKSIYGLENPQTEISLYLKNGEIRILYIGNETPDKANNYAYLEGIEKLVMLDATWKGVIARLVEDPPYPKWIYKFNPEEAFEIVAMKKGDIYKAYSKTDDVWFECILPITTNPCEGNIKANNNMISNFLIDFSNINILRAIKLNLMFYEDYQEYGLGLDAPYIDIKTMSKDQNGTNVIYNTSISIGSLNEDNSGYFAVAKQTKDVILTDKIWTDKILSIFN